MRFARRRSVALALVALASAGPLVVGAPSAAEGPTVSLDRTEVSPGDPVIVTMSGFTGGAVVVAACGNLAKRGSADCNMSASASEGINRRSAQTLEQLFVHPPPVPCPCLIRAWSTSNNEFAVAPIVIRGHPIAPAVEQALGPLVDVAVDAKRANAGFVSALRSALGGPTAYDVTVSVRNRTTETLANISLSGAASHRLSDEVASVDLPAPGAIDPGQTWKQTVRAELPAPSLGRYVWKVTAAGAGPAVHAEQQTDRSPVPLLLLCIVLVADFVAIAWRRLSRRRSREASALDSPGDDHGAALSAPWAAPIGPAL